MKSGRQRWKRQCPGQLTVSRSGKVGATIMDERYLRVKQVAAKIGMSEDWVRRYFGKIEGVRKIKSPAKRFKRPYTILLIPARTVDRELEKTSI
jgi:hypothetical protein